MCTGYLYRSTSVFINQEFHKRHTLEWPWLLLLSHWMNFFIFSSSFVGLAFAMSWAIALNSSRFISVLLWISSKRIYNSTTFHWIAGCFAYFSMTIDDDEDDDDADVRMPIKMHWELQSVCHIANYQICIRSEIQNNQHIKVTWKE